MSQFGGGRMGGVALAAGTSVPQTFRNVPPGAVARFLLTISFQAKSSGAAFAAVVSTAASAAAEAVDDLDLILNAIFSRLVFWPEAETQAFNLTPAQLRTILGLFNGRDFDGTFLNAVSIPVSTGSFSTFSSILAIPLSLERYFADGTVFAQGSMRLATGQIEYYCGSSLTPSVVLANGTASIQGVSVSLTAETGPGTPSDVGVLWRVNRQANLPNIWKLPDGLRIALLDTTPAASNPAADVTVGPFERVPPLNFAAKYQAERLTFGGFDVTKRCTPYLYMEKDRKFSAFGVSLGGKGLQIDAATGASSLAIYDVLAIPPSSAAVQQVSTVVGGGGEVSIMHPAPPSLPPGTAVPAELSHFLPVRVLPGKVGGDAVHQADSPNDAAQAVVKRQVRAGKVLGIARLLKGGGIK